MLRTLFLSFAILCVMAGCQGSKSPLPPTPGGSELPGAGAAIISISAEPQAGNWRVTLAASGDDLYQAAGELVFKPGRYEVLAIEAGGGFGGPLESYFLGKETSPGKIDFAYTKRYYGAGVSGKAAVLSLVVSAHTHFAVSDFRLATTPAPVFRNSQKQAMQVTGEVQ